MKINKKKYLFYLFISILFSPEIQILINKINKKNIFFFTLFILFFLFRRSVWRKFGWENRYLLYLSNFEASEKIKKINKINIYLFILFFYFILFIFIYFIYFLRGSKFWKIKYIKS